MGSSTCSLRGWRLHDLRDAIRLAFALGFMACALMLLPDILYAVGVMLAVILG